ncbi:MAG: carboxypeptidase-like regulatory domain-containing protein [bacterium]
MKPPWTTTVATVALSLTLAGCFTQMRGPAARTMWFREEEYDPYRVPGDASIEGQAFLKTRGGDVKYGAGNEVVLNPATSYSSEWYDRSVVRGEALEAPDLRATSFVRTMIADGEGRFRFENLTPGDYYLACRIVWEVPGSAFSQNYTGGIAHAEAHVDSGKTTKVILTR